MAAASAGPSSEGADTTIFLRATFLDARSKKSCLCLRVASHSSTKAFWDSVVEPALANWGGVSPSTELTLLCRGRRVDISPSVSLADIGVSSLTTLDVMARLPSQGFSRLHQLMEHLLEMLAPVVPPGGTPPAADDTANSSREPIMHAIDAEVKRATARLTAEQHDQGLGLQCGCLACTQRPNSTLWLCGALLHSTDAAVVNLTYRVLSMLLHARTSCPAPLVYFGEEAGALTLGARSKDFGHVFEQVQEALTPEGVAIGSLLSQRLQYDAKTHPLLWQHPTKKQTLLELAARSSCPKLLTSLLPSLNLNRLAGSGARSAGMDAHATHAQTRPQFAARTPHFIFICRGGGPPFPHPPFFILRRPSVPFSHPLPLHPCPQIHSLYGRL